MISVAAGAGLIWLAAATVTLLNVAAAGSVAVLYAWRTIVQRGRRAIAASFVPGLLSGVWIAGLALIASVEADNAVAMVLTFFGMGLVVGTLVSLPGALILSYKLDVPSDHERVFG